MKEFEKIYNNAPPLGKILIIIGVLALLVLLFIGLKKAFNKITTGPNSVDAAKDELKNLAKNGDVPNYSEAQFKTWADGLQQAMSGLGTEEDEIAKYFDYMQNKADVLQLIKSFGTRDYTDDKFVIWNIKPMNLNEWLSAELTVDEKDTYINDGLAKKNIDYKF